MLENKSSLWTVAGYSPTTGKNGCKKARTVDDKIHDRLVSRQQAWVHIAELQFYVPVWIT